MNEPATTRPLIRFLAHMLVILACWTLVIKFAFPIAYDLSYGFPPGEHIMWDFWWVVHLALARCLLNWKPYTVVFALVVSVVEIIIIAVKFGLFLASPQWDMWSSNWFINKVFVLTCFVVMLVYFAINRHVAIDDR